MDPFQLVRAQTPAGRLLEVQIRLRAGLGADNHRGHLVERQRIPDGSDGKLPAVGRQESELAGGLDRFYYLLPRPFVPQILVIVEARILIIFSRQKTVMQAGADDDSGIAFPDLVPALQEGKRVQQAEGQLKTVDLRVVQHPVDLDGVLSLTLAVASGVSTSLIANWIYDRFKKQPADSKTKRLFLRIRYSRVDYTDPRAIEKTLEAELYENTKDDA